LFGVEEVLLIFVIVLVVFGPDKLPDVARVLGKLTKEFGKVTYTAKRTWDEIGKEMELQEARERAKQLEAQQAAEAVAPASEGPDQGNRQRDLREEAGGPKETENRETEERVETGPQEATASLAEAVASDKQ